jgi:hypothetical protein
MVLEVGMKIVVYEFMLLALKRLSGLRQTFHVLSIKKGVKQACGSSKGAVTLFNRSKTGL